MIRSLLLALPILIIAWIAILALVMRLGGAAPAAFIPFPPAQFLATLPSDVAITGRSAISVTLRSETDTLARDLYRAGAWLVLPAGLEACIPNVLRRDV